MVWSSLYREIFKGVGIRSLIMLEADLSKLSGSSMTFPLRRPQFEALKWRIGVHDLC
jgi:hypothetical protein